MSRLALALLVVLGLASPGWAANAFVQSKSAYTSGDPISVTFDANVTAGNLVVVCIGADAATTPDVSGITLGSDTFTAINSRTAGNGRKISTHYLKNATGGNAVVTADLTASCSNCWIAAHEVSGADTSAPLDQQTTAAQAGAGTGTDAITTGAVTTTTNGQYIFGCAFDAGFLSGTFSAGTGYTLREQFASFDFSTEDRIQTSAGSIAATFTYTQNSGHALSAIATFKAGAAATSIRHRMILQ